MITDTKLILVGKLPVEIVKKKIKNLHIGVYPPQGHVRVAAPEVMSDESIKLAIITKLAWIRRHQNAFQKQIREPKRSMLRGESHYFRGQRFRLEVVEKEAPPFVSIKNKKRLTLQVRPGASEEKKKNIIDDWYRAHLKEVLPDLVLKWEKIMGAKVVHWGVKKMKVKWGSCNIAARRIWINLELAKKPFECLEYIVVHEMNHLLERHHSDRFHKLMDQFLPNWKMLRDQLNQLPLAHETWDLEENCKEHHTYIKVDKN